MRCFHSCPWCLLRLCWGMAGTARMLLVLLSISVSRAAASECAARFLHDLADPGTRGRGHHPGKVNGP